MTPAVVQNKGSNHSSKASCGPDVKDAWMEKPAPAAVTPVQDCSVSVRWTDSGGGGIDVCIPEDPQESAGEASKSFGIKGLFKKLSIFGRRRKDETEELPQPARRIVTTRDFSRLYELGDELLEPSRGGTEVRHAKKKKDGMPVVVKVRRKGKYGEDGCAFASAQDEAEWRQATEVVLNLSKHPHLTYVQEVLEDSGAFYVVMEKAHGIDLFETSRRQRGAVLSTVDIREILRQVLEALASIHSEGCLHRDLKLDNVVLDRSRRPRDPQSQQRCSHTGICAKIVDFDDAESWPRDSGTHGRGKPRCVVGTDQYIAPEAYSGEWSPASDVFSVGVMLFRLLNARFPFDPRIFDDAPGENFVGSRKMEEIRHRLEGSIIDFFRRARGAPESDPQALSLCRRMVAMDPRDRPSALEALEDPWFNPDNPFASTGPLRASSSSSSSATAAATPRIDAPPERTAAPPTEPGPLMPMVSTPKGQQATPATDKPLEASTTATTIAVKATLAETPPEAPSAVAAEPDGKKLAEALLSTATIATLTEAEREEGFIEVASATMPTLPGCVLEEEVEMQQLKMSRDRADTGSTHSGGTCGTRAGMVSSSRGSSYQS